MENSVVTHITKDSKYLIVFEQAASTKGIMGFKVETTGDDIDEVKTNITNLLNFAKGIAPGGL
jgi:hypothetical protein